MKNKTLHLAFALLAFAAINLSAQTSFIHTCDTLNKFLSWSAIDNTLLNNNPNALAFETQVWNPGGVGGTYNNHATGVWYNSIFDFNKWHWAIFNQDLDTGLIGVTFNILVPSETDDAFVHTANAGNILINWTIIDHPSLNNNPGAICIVTQNLNPSKRLLSSYNNQPIGVWYDGSKWAIYNQSIDAMPIDAAFNVLVPGDNYSAFKHTASSANIINNYTEIDHDDLNNKPNAKIFVTQRWEGVYNNNNIGVWYDTEYNKWAIFNQNTDSSMHENAIFNVVFVNESTTEVDATNAEEPLAGNFSIYPNPVQSEAGINFFLKESQNLKFELFATDGSLIKTLVNNNFSSGENTFSLDFSFINPGCYLLVMQGENVLSSKKLVVIE